MMETAILAKALYTNTPEAKGELFFRKGDILTVLEFDTQGQIGWWLCSLRGEKGLCPGNYLQLLKEGEYAPIYANQNEVEDTQPAYDIPRSHHTVAVPTINVHGNATPTSQTESTADLFYDTPRSVKSFDTRSNASLNLRTSQSGGSEISLMSSGTLSHYSSSSSSSASARSSEICGSGNEYQNSAIVNGNGNGFQLRGTTKESGFGGSNSVRSSGISSEADGLEDSWYDMPRPAPMSNNINRARTRPNSMLLDDSIDVYDVPRSIDDHDPSPGLGLNERVQLRNRANSACASHRRGQFIAASAANQGHGGSLTLSMSKLSFGSPFSHSLDDGSDETKSLYDRPPPTMTYSVGRKAPSSICSSSDTISISSAGNSNFRKVKRGSDATGMAGAASQESLGGIGGSGADVKILPLTPKAAVSVVEKMRQEVVTGLNSVLMFVKPKWRAKDNLEEIMPDLRFGCVRLNLAIKDFAEFCSRAVSNARKLESELLIAKLRRLLTPINSSSQIIQQSVYELEAYFWSPDRLSMSEAEENTATDALNHLILCSKNLSHHVTEIVNFLALNSSALFREVPVAPVEVLQPQPVAAPEDDPPDDSDYDYVVLNSDKPRPTPQPRQAAPTPPPPALALSPKDIQLLEFYSEHISTIGPLLSQSISTFISSIQQNEPPKVFNGHLKYVILLAYKLLFAGDTIHRNITDRGIKAEVEAKADDLHKSVVELHNMSKIASKHFPKILPMERIIEHVWHTTAAASQLKKVIFNATC